VNDFSSGRGPTFVTASSALALSFAPVAAVEGALLTFVAIASNAKSLKHLLTFFVITASSWHLMSGEFRDHWRQSLSFDVQVKSFIWVKRYFPVFIYCSLRFWRQSVNYVGLIAQFVF